MSLKERFLRYVAIDTGSSEESGQHPSTAKQWELARMLESELRQLGAENVRLKREVAALLTKLGHEPIDFGATDSASVDYPDFAAAVARAIQTGDCAQGVLVCGTGIGMSIAANKVAGIRAANVVRPDFAALAREHNDVNIVTLSARFRQKDFRIPAAASNSS